MYKRIFGLAAILMIGGCTRMTVRTDYERLANEFRSYEIGKPQFDADNPLLKKRIVLMSGDLNFSTAQTVCAQLVHLDDESQTEAIRLVINSGGGDTTAYMAVRNVVRSITAPVDTINIGICASSALMLFESATNKRYAVEDTLFCIHDPKGSPKEVVKAYREHLEEMLRLRCKLPEDWLPISGREFWFSAEDAVKYEVADEVTSKMNI